MTTKSQSPSKPDSTNSGLITKPTAIRVSKNQAKEVARLKKKYPLVGGAQIYRMAISRGLEGIEDVLKLVA